MKKSIVWLASYPKSGNTWLRAFLANYLANQEKPIAINQLYRFAQGDGQAQFYHKAAGHRIDVSDVPLTVRLRPKVLQRIVASGADVNLVKTHNRRSTGWNIDLIPAELTRSAIYVMRNPLDMVLSYARHFGMTNEEAATAICQHENAVAPVGNSVAQFLGSWSDHVESWTSAAPYPTLVLRYEDMLADPEAEFAKVIEHFGMGPDPERLARAIKHASFKELKKQESQQGFNERPGHSKAFFAQGKSGHWKDHLAPELVRKIRQVNKRAMKKYGYWND